MNLCFEIGRFMNLKSYLPDLVKRSDIFHMHWNLVTILPMIFFHSRLTQPMTAKILECHNRSPVLKVRNIGHRLIRDFICEKKVVIIVSQIKFSLVTGIVSSMCVTSSQFMFIIVSFFHRKVIGCLVCLCEKFLGLLQ